MKNHLTKWLSGVTVALLLTTFFACNKTGLNGGQPGPNQNRVSIYLTDGPGYFDKVFVNIQSIAVKIDTAQHWWGDNDNGPDNQGEDDQGNDDHDGQGHHHDWWNNWGNHDQDDQSAIWDTLKITPGIYNLLNFANGADTLLTSSNIPKGRIIAFKITLADNGNSLVKDSVSYPLHLLSGWNTVYVRVFGNNFQSVSSNHYKIWIDFDAGRSVIKVFNGMFYLRPVLRAFAVSNTGSVVGNVQPSDAYPVISVFNSSDTLYAIPGRGGMFMVRGLPAGTYNVFINTSNGYQDTTINNVTVSAGQTANLGSITLHK
ncbi:MAG: DUF4382 domain-containing protein [Chitinophagaceae bacterium]